MESARQGLRHWARCYFMLALGAVLAACCETSDTADLIREDGYTAETHQVKTSDGYYLTVFRIPGSKDCGETCGKPPVLLVSGLGGLSDAWLLVGKGKALPYLLADAGYDVWLGCNRGTRYSRKHEKLTTVDPKFWDFSWHEMGMHDVPAIIQLVLNTTRAEKLVYIGYSQGTTQFWVATSLLPDLHKSVAAMFAFGPVGFLSHTRNYLWRAAATAELAARTTSAIVGHREFLAHDCPIFEAARALCLSEQPGVETCTEIMYLALGFDRDRTDEETVARYYKWLPGGFSTKQVLHYGQVINAKNFQRYDYGPLGNMAMYNSLTPPAYNLTNNKVNISLFYGASDTNTDPRDLATLRKQLPHIVFDHLIAQPKFTHGDFITANDIKEYLHDLVMKRLELVSK